MDNNKLLYKQKKAAKPYLLDFITPESVYFYTLHKCASSLFSLYVLKNIQGLEHVDYALDMYNGVFTIDQEINFKERGYIYGPIRISGDPRTPEYKRLTIPASQPEFIQDKIVIFLVRDPRDILVSSYYSFAYSHGVSSVKEIRKIQETSRKVYLAQSLDEYVLAGVSEQLKNFTTIAELSKMCQRCVLLKYEDMIDKFDYFIAQLRQYLLIDDNIVQEIYRRSRPKLNEEIASHQRSGKVGGYKDKLRQDTIKSLNSKLGEILEVFEYKL